MEHRGQTHQRWQPDSPAYQHAFRELRVHHVLRLQLMIEKQAGGIKALTSALDRRHSSASNRHDMTRLTTNRSKKKAALRAAVLDLRFWHSVGQDPLPGTPYDAESLDVDDLCEQGLPWVAQEWSIPTELVQQQHYFRAIEEQQIIKREADDAEAFYSHYVRQCKIVQEASAEQCMQIESSQEMQAFGEQSFLPGAQHLQYSQVAQKRLLLQLSRGKMSLIDEKMAWCAARLFEMEGVISWLESEEAIAPAMPDASAVIDDGVFGQNDVIEGLHVGALEGMLARIPDVQGNDVQDEDLS